MNIAKIFCQSLGVTSHAKTFLMVCHFRTNSRGIRSNGLGYPFQNKNVICSDGLSYLFTKSVICLNSLCYLFEQLGLSIWKKLLSFRTAMAIHSKTKLSTIRATEAICSKINFSRVNSIPKQFYRYFVSNDLLFLSGHIMKFV